MYSSPDPPLTASNDEDARFLATGIYNELLDRMLGHFSGISVQLHTFTIYKDGIFIVVQKSRGEKQKIIC